MHEKRTNQILGVEEPLLNVLKKIIIHATSIQSELNCHMKLLQNLGLHKRSGS